MTGSAPVATDCTANVNALLVIGSILWLGFSLHRFLQLPFKVLRVIWQILSQPANGLRKNLFHSYVLIQNADPNHRGEKIHSE